MALPPNTVQAGNARAARAAINVRHNPIHWPVHKLFFISLFQYILAVGLTTGMSAIGWGVLRPKELSFENTLMFASIGSAALGGASWVILTPLVYLFNLPLNGDYSFIYRWFCHFQVVLFALFVMASDIIGFLVMKLYVHLPILDVPIQAQTVLSIGCVGSVISMVLAYIGFAVYYAMVQIRAYRLEHEELLREVRYSEERAHLEWEQEKLQLRQQQAAINWMQAQRSREQNGPHNLLNIRRQ